MNAIHRITGYEKRTERLEMEYDVPPGQLPELRQLANVPSSDVDAIGSYRLPPEAISKAAAELKQTLNTDAYDWYLEAFAPA